MVTADFGAIDLHYLCFGRSDRDDGSILNGTILFVSSFMFFVVFKRAIALKQIAEAQDSENRRLWWAISELREKAGAQSALVIKKDASSNPSDSADK